MKKLSLVELKIGRKARIIEIHAGRDLLTRFMSMGIYPGKEITKLSHFMLRGPVAIKVGRTILALGYGMAHKITVETDD